MNNTVKRSLSGVCFLAIVISGLLLNKYLYGALLIFMMVTMLYEFYHMTMGDLFPRSRWLAILVGVSAFVMLFCVMAFRLDIRQVSLSAVLLLFLMISTLFARACCTSRFRSRSPTSSSSTRRGTSTEGRCSRS